MSVDEKNTFLETLHFHSASDCVREVVLVCWVRQQLGNEIKYKMLYFLYQEWNNTVAHIKQRDE